MNYRDLVALCELLDNCTQIRYRCIHLYRHYHLGFPMGLKRDEIWKMRLRDARHAIAASIEQRTYAPAALEQLLSNNRENWRLSQTLTAEFFCDYLVKTKLLKRVTFSLRDKAAAPSSYVQEHTVYAKPEATPLEVALALRTGSFLSHLAAAYVHGLTDIVPRSLQTNREQAAKIVSGQPRALTQDAIERVFSAPARTTGQVYVTEGYEVTLLSGQNTGRLDVVDINAADSRTYPTTSLERTLVDCVVRPSYAGGIHEVMNLYVSAKERLSVRRLRKLLDDLHFLYPYRQAIGFLLERTGHPDSRLALFEQPPFEYDFYLDYAIPKRAYSTRWRLFYPEGM